MTTVNAVRLRATLADTLNQVAYAHERVIVEKHGKAVAALVPMEDLEILRALEDRIDLDAAREALAEPGTSRSWAEVKAELGL
jgi:prevent-host-death family protein